MPTLPTLKKDPSPGGPTTDGSTIFTDQHNAIVDIISGDSTDKIPESALAGGGGDASAWSTFDASQDVNLAGNALSNVLGFAFPILGQGLISHAAGFRWDLPAAHAYTWNIDTVTVFAVQDVGVSCAAPLFMNNNNINNAGVISTPFVGQAMSPHAAGFRWDLPTTHQYAWWINNFTVFAVEELGASLLVPLFMNNNTISNLPTPVLSHQAANKEYVDTRKQSLIIPASGEDESLAVGTGKATFRMPYGFTLTGVRASVKTAPTGSAVTVDINENGASVLSTPITIDDAEKTSTTAATPPVISDVALADDAEITIDIDAVGSTTAGNGLKVYLIGTIV